MELHTDQECVEAAREAAARLREAARPLTQMWRAEYDREGKGSVLVKISAADFERFHAEMRRGECVRFTTPSTLIPTLSQGERG